MRRRWQKSQCQSAMMREGLEQSLLALTMEEAMRQESHEALGGWKRQEN